MTPRHQGLGEREHITMITDLLLLMKAVTNTYPAQWAALLPAVEYILWTAPQGAHGFSAHDFDSAHSLATSVDATLQPFMVPSGLPETDTMPDCFRPGANFMERSSGSVGRKGNCYREWRICLGLVGGSTQARLFSLGIQRGLGHLSTFSTSLVMDHSKWIPSQRRLA